MGSVTLPQFSFGTVQTEDGGIFGVSFEEQESSADDGETYPNFVFASKQQGYIDRAVFSIFSPSASSSEVTFLLGGIDHAKFSGDLAWNKVPDPSRGASILVDDFSVNGVNFSLYSSFAVDTGSVATLIPDDVFQHLTRTVQVGSWIPDLGCTPSIATPSRPSVSTCPTELSMHTQRPWWFPFRACQATKVIPAATLVWFPAKPMTASVFWATRFSETHTQCSTWRTTS